jgi:hypothetical protein
MIARLDPSQVALRLLRRAGKQAFPVGIHLFPPTDLRAVYSAATL